MGLGKSIEKLDDYFARLKKGKVQKIKPSHVEKVIGKLKAKEKSLQADLASAKKETKKSGLTRKLTTVAEQLQRAKWLLEKVR
mgnify:CR=1 FL=1